MSFPKENLHEEMRKGTQNALSSSDFLKDVYDWQVEGD